MAQGAPAGSSQRMPAGSKTSRRGRNTFFRPATTSTTGTRNSTPTTVTAIPTPAPPSTAPASPATIATSPTTPATTAPTIAFRPFTRPTSSTIAPGP